MGEESYEGRNQSELKENKELVIGPDCKCIRIYLSNSSRIEYAFTFFGKIISTNTWLIFLIYQRIIKNSHQFL